MMARTLVHGHPQFNTRTGQICHVTVGTVLEFDLREGFPAPTTKKHAFTQMCGELFGFFRGYQSAAQFRALGCNVWNKNANETPAWLASRHRKGEDDLGLIYGANWTAWKDRRFVDAKEREFLLKEGFSQIMYDPVQGLYGMERSINQLEEALRTILTNPSDRRIIISGWNIATFDQAALPPCHVSYQFIPFEDTREMDVVMVMRSWDTMLGFNVQLTALFLEIMARLSGYTACKCFIQVGNEHIYDSHVEAVKTMLSREPYPAPRLVLSENIKKVTLDEIPGVFTRIEPEDVTLEGYQHHPAIKAQMAA